MSTISKLCIITLFFVSSSLLAEENSTCYGTTANGNLSNGWKLPSSGENFTSYSILGGLLGRTYVHSTVHNIFIESYQALADASSDMVFVYGETGFESGGEFEPHKTHRNGLSVDFMVPVRNEAGKSVPLPTSVLNKWGYDHEFDAQGQLNNLTIDYVAIGEHLYHLHQSSKRHGVDIWRVIFAPELQPMLQASPRWEYLQSNLQFSTKRSWVRHDEHYHVDFSIPCKPAA